MYTDCPYVHKFSKKQYIDFLYYTKMIKNENKKIYLHKIPVNMVYISLMNQRIIFNFLVEQIATGPVQVIGTPPCWDNGVYRFFNGPDCTAVIFNTKHTFTFTTANPSTNKKVTYELIFNWLVEC